MLSGLHPVVNNKRFQMTRVLNVGSLSILKEQDGQDVVPLVRPFSKFALLQIVEDERARHPQCEMASTCSAYCTPLSPTSPPEVRCLSPSSHYSPIILCHAIWPDLHVCYNYLYFDFTPCYSACYRVFGFLPFHFLSLV